MSGFYWLGFFLLNKLLSKWYEYKIRSQADLAFSFISQHDIEYKASYDSGDDEKVQTNSSKNAHYNIYYNNDTEEFVVFQALYDRLLNPVLTSYGNSVFIGPMLFAWIQDGTIMRHGRT